MAYEIKFNATDDADWVQAVELFDDDTSEPLADAADATYELSVKHCGSVVLTASSEAGTITKPESNVIRWRFTVSELGALCPGNTYSVGCTMAIDGGQVLQLFTGTLVFTDGSVA